ncbi:Uncharacterised protein [Mycobacteroides abscessus subsp. abscessus]|uniref:hypothetical protein n=1 Tax=Mycobacteroides abscessus TaxID=36809 RepID=UPI0009276A82|nr:hypothetical protein [Mycobacteroides abscessus]SHU85755.1 Uncharacterised protein [Mycobacteroides abscessus subsp. abscessus]
MLFSTRHQDYLKLFQAEHEIKAHECEQCYISGDDDDLLLFESHFDAEGGFIGRLLHIGELPEGVEEDYGDYCTYPLFPSAPGKPSLGRLSRHASKIDAEQ